MPLDPSRYLELPWALGSLAAKAGDRVLDLASPKLLAVELARRGVEVTSIDQFEREIETWRRLAAGKENLTFQVADGRSLPFEDASFDHAYSISVLEHIADDGDFRALRELAQGRQARRARRRDRALRAVLSRGLARPARVRDHGDVGGSFFFQRWYDDERLDRLVAAAPALEPVTREVVRMQPNWNDAYVRRFPWLVPLGPFYGVLGRERTGFGGDVARIALVRRT